MTESNFNTRKILVKKFFSDCSPTLSNMMEDTEDTTMVSLFEDTVRQMRSRPSLTAAMGKFTIPYGDVNMYRYHLFHSQI